MPQMSPEPCTLSKVNEGPESTASTEAEGNTLCQTQSLRTPSTVHTTPGVLDSGPEAAGPVHWSHDRPAGLHCNRAANCLCANVSHDAILQHSDARSWSVVAVVLNRNFSLRFGSVNRFESIRPDESIRIDSNRFSHHYFTISELGADWHEPIHPAILGLY